MKKIAFFSFALIFVIGAVSFVWHTSVEAEKRSLLQLKINDDYLGYLSEEVKSENSRLYSRFSPLESEVFEQATAFHSHVLETIRLIDQTRANIIEATGGYEDQNEYQGMYVGASDIVKTESILIGSGNGLAYTLKQKLNTTYSEMKRIAEGAEGGIALDIQDDVRIYNPAYKKYDFVQFYFKGTPMLISISKLTSLKMELLMMEKNALKRLLGGVKEDGQQVLVPLILNSSEVVAPGTKVSAEVMLAALPKGTPEYFFRGRKIEVNPSTHTAKFSFTAPGGAYDMEGYSRQRFEITYKLKVGGKDTFFILQKDYLLKKPVIQVSSPSVFSLYRNCGNALSVQIPDIKENYIPDFSADNAEIIYGKAPGEIFVVPFGNTMNLQVKSNGNYYGNREFQVNPIPLPRIYFSDGKKAFKTDTLDLSIQKQLKLTAVPDSAFARQCPKDAEFAIPQYTLSIIRSGNTVWTKKYSNESINSLEVFPQLKSGDVLQATVHKVVRKTYSGSTEVLHKSQVQILVIIK